MEIMKFCLIAIAIVFAITFTKQIKPELAVLITVAGAIVMLAYLMGFFNNITVLYNKLIDVSGIDDKYFSILLKAIGIAYLVEFASNICKDSGNTTISDKVVLAGKISILLLATPIIQSIFGIISGLL